MSLLVRYSLKDAADHDHQVQAMRALVTALGQEGVPITYSCFSSEDATQFVGLMEFSSEDDFKAFQDSEAFATYKAAVGPTFSAPPSTTRLTAIASTRG